jgi:hypothetical protein
MKRIFFWLTAFSMVFSLNLRAEPLVLESAAEQSILIELYTSEGCNSCPPAERYLNSYTDHEDLWSKYIPVAFHVDYWNDLGWKDRFSSAQYSQRQRRYATVKRQRTVYTPAFMVNGENWRPGFYNAGIDVKQSKVGALKLVIENGQVQGHFMALGGATEPAVLNLALLGMKLESRISAGENRGKHARHEFVVLSHQQYSSSSNQWRVPLPAYQGDEAMSFALVGWVSRPGDPSPVQAVGGPIASQLVSQSL